MYVAIGLILMFLFSDCIILFYIMELKFFGIDKFISTVIIIIVVLNKYTYNCDAILLDEYSWMRYNRLLFFFFSSRETRYTNRIFTLSFAYVISGRVKKVWWS